MGDGMANVFGGFAAYFDGVLMWSGQLSDEFSWVYFVFGGSEANIDARMTTSAGGFTESADQSVKTLLTGRVTLLKAIEALKKYEPPSGRAKIGEAYALIGYAEVLLAEDYCAGVPLGQLAGSTGVQYGMPLSTDSLLGVAEADFDSALAYGAGSDTVQGLAGVGLGRARLDRGHDAAAATAVTAVPTSFVYNSLLEPNSAGTTVPPNIYAFQTSLFRCGEVNVADRKGGNGVNFVSAHDPRLVVDSTIAETCDGHYGHLADSVWYYPVKFGNPSSAVPLATGVEARLIEAEAMLRAGNPSTWAATLNTLRANAPATYLALASPMDTLTSDSTLAASPATQVDVTFRERAFWLYGTGTRLGDLRRLIRQYGRDQSTVFPTGAYPNGANPNLPAPIPNYGTDVNLTLPTAAGGLTTPNPNYKGCTTSTKVA